MPSLRWGLSLSLSEELAEPAAIAEVASTAEASGWDGVFVWDHLFNRTGQPFADPWVTLAAIAIATRRVWLGTLVTPLPRRRWQIVAQHVATLDRLSSGRMLLGLGLGHDGHGEYSTFDEPLTDDKARAARLDAELPLLLPALGGEPVAAAGGRRTTIACAQRPRCPVWVAGRVGFRAGPRRAARHGLEGVALVGGEDWQPGHVTDALAAADRAPGALEVILVGGRFSAPDALAAAGATWAIPEVMPGTSLAEARALAAAPPGAARP